MKAAIYHGPRDIKTEEVEMPEINFTCKNLLKFLKF